MKGYLDYYLTMMRISIAAQLQYRVSQYFYMIGMIAEPVIYLVVWSSIARAHGGTVEGFSADQFAAYYIVWTLVRNMNIGFTPFGWEQRIKGGEFSALLLRPIHPLHHDIAYFAGWKAVMVLLWLPIAVVLSVAFHPSLHPSVLEVLVFFAAIWGAYLLRSMMLFLLGLITFFTTRIGAIFDLFFAAELLLSGRLVPMALMPGWAQRVADFLPFQWTFSFPIEALIGKLDTADLLRGLLIQVLWITLGAGLVRLCWAPCLRRYSAVGA